MTEELELSTASIGRARDMAREFNMQFATAAAFKQHASALVAMMMVGVLSGEFKVKDANQAASVAERFAKIIMTTDLSDLQDEIAEIQDPEARRELLAEFRAKIAERKK